MCTVLHFRCRSSSTCVSLSFCLSVSLLLSLFLLPCFVCLSIGKQAELPSALLHGKEYLDFAYLAGADR